MQNSIKTEAKLRTIKLEAQEQSKAVLDALELKMGRLYVQKYETIKGVRKKITKRRRIALMNQLIDREMDKVDIEIDQDVLNQLRVLNNVK